MEKSVFSKEYSVFLQRLRSARRRAGMTQQQLAEATGQTQSFVSKCERGERRVDVVELGRFCTALGLSLSEFAAELEQDISF